MLRVLWLPSPPVALVVEEVDDLADEAEDRRNNGNSFVLRSAIVAVSASVPRSDDGSAEVARKERATHHEEPHAGKK